MSALQLFRQFLHHSHPLHTLPPVYLLTHAHRHLVQLRGFSPFRPANHVPLGPFALLVLDSSSGKRHVQGGREGLLEIGQRYHWSGVVLKHGGHALKII